MKNQKNLSGQARSMALLWRTSEPVSRDGRTDLNVDRVATAAIALVDADGLSALTMRRVGESLGLGTMSVYTYVPGKAELLDLMIDTVYHELPRAAYTEPCWRARLERVAHDNWELYRRHPWLARVESSRPVLGPNLMKKYDLELRALDGTGLNDVELDAVLSLVLGHVRSAARDAADVAELESHTGMTDRQWWDVQAPYLARLAGSADFSTARRVGDAAGCQHNTAYDPGYILNFGLARLLDGIAVLVERKTRK